MARITVIPTPSHVAYSVPGLSFLTYLLLAHIASLPMRSVALGPYKPPLTFTTWTITLDTSFLKTIASGATSSTQSPSPKKKKRKLENIIDSINMKLSLIAIALACCAAPARAAWCCCSQVDSSSERCCKDILLLIEEI
ncbi:hypothetical protein OPQ81_006139 [Rhizoctonia solani]|nr:hypothetical protein OPQ81_006139 [Rhizoctonia solani]